MFRILARISKEKKPNDLPHNYIIKLPTDQGFDIGIDVPIRDICVCSPVAYNNIKQSTAGHVGRRDPTLDYIRKDVEKVAAAFVDLYRKLGMRIPDYTIITPDDKTWAEYHYLREETGGDDDVNNTESGSTGDCG